MSCIMYDVIMCSTGNQRLLTKKANVEDPAGGIRVWAIFTIFRLKLRTFSHILSNFASKHILTIAKL